MVTDSSVIRGGRCYRLFFLPVQLVSVLEWSSDWRIQFIVVHPVPLLKFRQLGRWLTCLPFIRYLVCEFEMGLLYFSFPHFCGVEGISRKLR
uniref:Uncharacterized protein n=1 Tax=Arundo donax TaxID=35708 RepID=A0A0A8Y633_ARUDO